MGRMARLVLGGWGRQAAWTMLVFFLLLQVFVPSLFDAARLSLFDGYQRLMGRDRHTDAVVIVAIDDASLARIGRSPEDGVGIRGNEASSRQSGGKQIRRQQRRV